MGNRAGLVAGLMVLAATLQAQQPAPPRQPQKSPQTQGQRPEGQQAQAQEPPFTIYRVELVPTGFGFAMNEPVLEGDVYVFRSLPDRALERVPKSKVKSVTRWSTDYSNEVVFQVEFAPTGSILVREEPAKKGSGYVLKTWRQGSLLSVKEGDVRKINRLTGFDAFKAEMAELGVSVLEHDTTHGGFKTTADSPAPGAAASQNPAAKPGNWTYQGVPGASDAYAPAGGTVSKPGDTPMAPEPTRSPH